MYVVLYLHLTKNDVVLETRSGIKIKLRVNSTDLMAFTHVWILQEYDKPSFKIKNDDIIIDIGAHIGLFALYASQFCKNGRIYCFEPMKENFEMLETNLKLNSITNVFPVNTAVSTDAGNVIIYLSDDESGHSMHVTGSERREVAATSLKNIIDENKIERCDFVKIDCEGEEYEIINSLPLEYFLKIKKMIIEYHFADIKPQLIENLIKKLKSLSYIVETRALFPSIGFLYARRYSKAS